MDIILNIKNSALSTLSIVKEAVNENNNQGIVIIGMIVVIVCLIIYTIAKNKGKC